MSFHIKTIFVLFGFIIGGLFGIFVTIYGFLQMEPAIYVDSSISDKITTSTDISTNVTIKDISTDPLSEEVDHIQNLYTLGEYEEKNTQFDIMIRYPKFGIVAVDSDISTFIQDTVADFKQRATEYAEDANMAGYYMETNFQTSHYNDNIVSIDFSMAEYTGGAHPTNYRVGKTFNLMTQKQLDISDVFTPSPTLGATLETMVEARLKDTMGTGADVEWIEIGVTEMYLMYEDIWIVGPQGVTFFFAPYVVSSYADGPQEILLTWNELDGLLTDTFTVN